MGFRASASAVVTKISDEPSNLSLFPEACVMQTLFGHGLQWSEPKLLATSRVHNFDKFWSEMSFAWTEARSHEYRTASLPTMNTALLQVLQLSFQHFLALLQMLFIASISPARLWAWFYSSSLYRILKKILLHITSHHRFNCLYSILLVQSANSQPTAYSFSKNRPSLLK